MHKIITTVQAHISYGDFIKTHAQLERHTFNDLKALVVQYIKGNYSSHMFCEVVPFKYKSL